ncbi:hypothetical protein PFICI_08493 [Pestalotiopsis fici W106-1]|uniref:Uncharacterized protein n=1 Tax=Pestalotiopsis fici (strain W106-1 / CGMCC3.15140) TaxID=1229662 RepID=W3WXS5_PESFW|nr:uncharacterized protein PFICI_08493 [Pestalotiopsis fici W106-1]ETS78640.1 hypothetical protein PFICI_08493 [Pestalotiopsis fici W106-1]
MAYPLDHFPHLNGAPPTVHPVISGSQNDRSSLTDENVDWDQLLLRFQDDVDEQTWAADTSAIGEAQSQSEHPAGSPGPELDLIGAGDLAPLLKFLNEPVLPVPLPSPQPQQDQEDEPLLLVPPPQQQQDEEEDDCK